jgi:hypothetical protein
MEGVVDMVHDRVTYRSKTLFCRNRIDPTRIVKWMPNAYALCIAHLEVSCVVSFFTRNFKKKQSWMPPFKKQVCAPYGNLWCGSACAPCGTLRTVAGTPEGRQGADLVYPITPVRRMTCGHSHTSAHKQTGQQLQIYYRVVVFSCTVVTIQLVCCLSARLPGFILVGVHVSVQGGCTLHAAISHTCTPQDSNHGFVFGFEAGWPPFARIC